MQNMLAAFAVTEFNNMAQDGNEHVAVSRSFVNLVCYEFRKAHLFHVQPDSIAHAVLHDHLVERTVDKIGNAKFKSFFYMWT